MQRMADSIAQSGGRILEVGFGLGLSASAMQAKDIARHVIIESNQDVVSHFNEWKRQFSQKDIRIVEGCWSDVIGNIESGSFDGVFFDAYPQTEAEATHNLASGFNVAERFVPEAARILSEGGKFTYYSNERDSLPRRMQRLLLEHFSSIELEYCSGLDVPEGCNYWHYDQMLVVTASK